MQAQAALPSCSAKRHSDGLFTYDPFILLYTE
uniref:Uncharacterized protein n=1 Tax=Anguilla anguilla TaxID=7936 RepID=A0A0E9UPE8_ANGAN